MEFAKKDYIINTVFKTNILPIISECNTSCVFCSHKQNPKGVEVFRMPKLELSDFKEIIDYLSPEKKIIIGEAATRIIEGEPLLHKDFIDILKLLRAKYKKTTIQITTNAILLDNEMINDLVKLGNIELNISVNSANSEKRKRILGVKHEENIKEKIKLLCGRLRFSGSVVLVPEILKNADIEEVVVLLEENGADTVRLYLPGYTHLADKAVDLFALFTELREYVYHLRRSYKIPIIIEPYFLSSLDSRVEGIIQNTPAAISGLMEGDIILEVDGEAVETRVDAFYKAYRCANPVLKVLSGSNNLSLKLKKSKNAPPGFVVLYDIDPNIVEKIDIVIKRHNVKDVLIMTSELAVGVLDMLLRNRKPELKFRVVSVKNKFFGGTIKCAGLLTIQDILDAAKEWLIENEKPELILLPPIMFDFKNRDLLGMKIEYLEEQLGIPVDIP